MEQKFWIKLQGTAMNGSLWLFKASQPEDPIIPFTTQNTQPGFIFVVDNSALAFISAVKWY